MKKTQWQPIGKAVDTVNRELSKTIRANLPAIVRLNQPDWAHGSLLDLGSKMVPLGKLVQLNTLHWRLLESIEWEKRAASRGVFSGQAWGRGGRIDFTGDSVRDLATGAFLEFQLLTMGL